MMAYILLTTTAGNVLALQTDPRVFYGMERLQTDTTSVFTAAGRFEVQEGITDILSKMREDNSNLNG